MSTKEVMLRRSFSRFSRLCKECLFGGLCLGKLLALSQRLHWKETPQRIFLDGFVSESNKVFGDINTEQTRAFVGITFPVKNILAISGSLRETSVVEKLTVKIGACTEFLLLNIQQLFMHIFLFIPEQSFFFICKKEQLFKQIIF